MAEIEILTADVTGGRIQSLQVRIHNASTRTIDRATALLWAREGHTLIPIAGHGHDVVRGAALSLVEVGEEEYLRTDTKAKADDVVNFPH